MRKKRVLILGDINSSHLKKWLISLATDYDLAVFSFHAIDEVSRLELKGLTLQLYCRSNNNQSSKGQYFLQYFRLSKLFKNFNPDIVHAHYASSYGFFGALLNSKQLIVSAWGSDVFDFPKKSLLHTWIIKFVFKRAKLLMSTSRIMAEEMKLYTKKTVIITPFGISIEKFCPSSNRIENTNFVVGTVKSLEHVYGIDLLIKAFKEFHDQHPNSVCHIYGKGSKESEYQKLAQELGLTEAIKFMGYVPNESVPEVLHTFDVFCALSRAESFGVAVLEASACALPVIVSRAGGLREVVDENVTGFIVDNTNLKAVRDKLLYFATNNEGKQKMGQRGRIWVKEQYSWSKSVALMKAHYAEMNK